MQSTSPRRVAGISGGLIAAVVAALVLVPASAANAAADDLPENPALAVPSIASTAPFVKPTRTLPFAGGTVAAASPAVVQLVATNADGDSFDVQSSPVSATSPAAWGTAFPGTGTIALPPEGGYTVVAYTIEGGERSAPSAPTDFVVDGTAPPAPTFGLSDGATITNPAAPIPIEWVLSDYAAYGDRYNVAYTLTRPDGTKFSNTYLAPASASSYDLRFGATPVNSQIKNYGAYSLAVTLTDSTGNKSAASTLTFTVTPPAPVITAPGNGDVVNTTTPKLTGTGAYVVNQPGRIDVVENGATLCSATVQSSVTLPWNCTAGELTVGTHTVTAVQTVPGEATQTSDPITFTIPATAVAITSPTEGDTTTTLPTITGTGEAGLTVAVTDGAAPIGTATIGTDGTWTLTPTARLTPGEHTITATQSDGSTATITFTAAAAPVQITSPDNGATLSARPVIAGTGEPGDTVTVTTDTASDSAPQAAASTVGEDGTWMYTFDTALAPGAHIITATQSDGSTDTVRVVIEANTGPGDGGSVPGDGSGAPGTGGGTTPGTGDAPGAQSGNSDIVPTSTTTTAHTGELAYTGSEGIAPVAIAAALAVLLGSATMLYRRRKRS